MRVKKNFNEGKIYGGKDCLGYKIVNGQFEVVPEEADLVKHITIYMNKAMEKTRLLKL